jgi:hypothetical protein
MVKNMQNNNGQQDNSHEMLVQTKESKEYFIEQKFLENLSSGSYEAHVKRISELASKNISKIVGENIKTNIYPLCTFKRHAVFSDDFSNLYRIEFDGSDKELEILKVEQIDDIRKFAKEDIEAELGNVCAEALTNAIANPSAECDNRLKEGFVSLLAFRTSGIHTGYINLQKPEN